MNIIFFLYEYCFLLDHYRCVQIFTMRLICFINLLHFILLESPQLSFFWDMCIPQKWSGLCFQGSLLVGLGLLLYKLLNSGQLYTKQTLYFQYYIYEPHFILIETTMTIYKHFLDHIHYPLKNPLKTSLMLRIRTIYLALSARLWKIQPTL